MISNDITRTAAGLLAEFGDASSAERAAGARGQTACNAIERNFWGAVRLLLAAAEDTRSSAARCADSGQGPDTGTQR